MPHRTARAPHARLSGQVTTLPHVRWKKNWNFFVPFCPSLTPFLGSPSTGPKLSSFLRKKNWQKRVIRGMSSPVTSKTSRPIPPFPKDYHREVSEMETNNLLRSTFTDDCRTEKGDQKTCLLYGLSYFWRPTSSMPSSFNTSRRLVRAGSLLCVWMGRGRVLSYWSRKSFPGFHPPKDGKGFRDFYHNWTTSILQQVNFFFFGNCRCIVPNFKND
jgi:hypothetical protein